MRIGLHRPANGQLKNKSRHERWMSYLHLAVRRSWKLRWSSRPPICKQCRLDKHQVGASLGKAQRSRLPSTHCLVTYIAEDLLRVTKRGLAHVQYENAAHMRRLDRNHLSAVGIGDREACWLRSIKLRSAILHATSASYVVEIDIGTLSMSQWPTCS
jgi:hypothetical protein